MCMKEGSLCSQNVWSSLDDVDIKGGKVNKVTGLGQKMEVQNQVVIRAHLSLKEFRTKCTCKLPLFMYPWH